MDSSPDWNTSWGSINSFSPLQDSNMFFVFLDRFFDRNEKFTKSAIEIGCFPGRFIDYFGSKGFVISGIDTYPGVVQLNDWMRGRHGVIGEFTCSSLNQFVTQQPNQFDAVVSFGFIEHFVNFPEIIEQHARLCIIGGFIVIGAPNFASPFQRALHRLLDPGNLEKHVLSSMYPIQWEIVARYLGLEVIYSGNLGRFGFWYEDEPTTPKIAQLRKSLPLLAGYLEPLGNKFNKLESSYGIIVLRKADEFPYTGNSSKGFFDGVIHSSQALSNRDEELSDKHFEFLSYLCNDG